MYNLSSSEAPRFVQIAEEMTRGSSTLGPNPIRKNREIIAAKDLGVPPHDRDERRSPAGVSDNA